MYVFQGPRGKPGEPGPVGPAGAFGEARPPILRPIPRIPESTVSKRSPNVFKGLISIIKPTTLEPKSSDDILQKLLTYRKAVPVS